MGDLPTGYEEQAGFGEKAKSLAKLECGEMGSKWGSWLSIISRSEEVKSQTVLTFSQCSH